MREWLSELRKAAKLTQKDVATVLGVTVQQYNFIENGKRQLDLNLSTAAKLSDLFNVPLSTIRNYEEELHRVQSKEGA